jgi:hypothetical protein
MSSSNDQQAARATRAPCSVHGINRRAEEDMMPRSFAPTLTDPRPADVPDPDEVDPDEGTEPDGTPVENPSGLIRI